MKICSRCTVEKPLDEFITRSQSKDGKGAWCKECAYIYKQEKNNPSNRRESLKLWQRKFRQTQRFREWDSQYRAKYKSSISGLASAMLSAARNRSRATGHEVTIDREWLVRKLLPLRCEVTGVELTLDIDKSVQHTPFRPSLDRIDNSKGYTEDNTRAKSDCTDEDVLKMFLSWKNMNGKV
jgi:hypothetical protein